MSDKQGANDGQGHQPDANTNNGGGLQGGELIGRTPDEIEGTSHIPTSRSAAELTAHSTARHAHAGKPASTTAR